jgi:titin
MTGHRFTAKLAGFALAASTFTMGLATMGQSPASAADTAPAAPTAVSAARVASSDGYGAVTVSWTAGADGGQPIRQYKIEQRNATTNALLDSRTLSGQRTSAVVSYTAYVGQSSKFRVYAINSIGESAAGITPTAVTPAAVPSAPTAVTASRVASSQAVGGVNVAWTAPADDGGAPIQQYKVEQLNATNDVIDAKYLSGRRTSGVVSFSYYVATPSRFRVSALNQFGWGATGITSGTITPAAVPSAPTAVTTSKVSSSAGYAAINVSWTAPSDDGGAPVQQYRVEQLNVSDNGVLDSKYLSGRRTSGVVSFPYYAGTSTYFKVYARNQFGESAGGSTAASPLTAASVPSAPTGVSAALASDGSGAIVVSWTQPANDGGAPIYQYQIQQRNATTGDVLDVRSVSGRRTSATVQFPSYTGTSSRFRVIALNQHGAGAESANSGALVTPAFPTAATAVPSAPGTPVATRVTSANGYGAVSLTWTAPSDLGGGPINGYQINLFNEAGTYQGQVFSAGSGTTAVLGYPDIYPNYLYNFEVVALNGVGSSDPSARSAPDVEPASSPNVATGVSATRVASSSGQGAVSVSWTAPTDDGGAPITGYEIRWYFEGNHYGTVTQAGNATSAIIGYPDIYTNYALTYRVAAINGFGTADQSADSNVITVGSAGAPTGVSATRISSTNGQGAATVSWTAPTDDGGAPVTGYEVRWYYNGNHYGTLQVAGNATSAIVGYPDIYSDLPLTFTVSATSQFGAGTESTQSNVVTPAGLPSAPLLPTTAPSTLGVNAVDLQWTAPVDDGGAPITRYLIEFSSVTSGYSSSVYRDGSATSAIIGYPDLSQTDTDFKFRVTALNAYGQSVQSVESIPATVSSPPSSVTATPADVSASVSWTAPSNNGYRAITGYRVTPYIGATAQTPQVFSGTATTRTVTGLTNGTSYTFKVAALNAVGYSSDSAASAAVTPRTVPGAPTAVSATPGDVSAAVSWTAPSSNGGAAISGYTVTPYIGATAQTAQVFNSTATTQTVTGLTNGTAYTFKVAATNVAGTGAQSAASAAVTPRTVPGAPTGVSASPGNTNAAVSWTAPASDGGAAISGYTVTPYIGAAAQTASTFDATSTSRTITGLTNGTAYTFKVAATNVAGTGAQSAASAAVTPRTVPGAPTGVSATPGDTSAVVSWTAPASNGGATITNYTVTPYIGAASQTPTVFDASATSRTVTGLTNGTAYTFQVSATNVAGTGSASTASAAVTPRTVPGAPTAVTATPGDTTASVSWTAPASNGGSAVTGYTVTPYIGVAAQTPSAFASTATTQSISGLVNGTAYTFKVAATNVAGTGTDSAASAAVTPRTVPGAPTAVTATPGDATASVSWTAPASNGGSAVTGYTVTPYIGVTAQTPQVFASTATTQTVTGLTNGTSYTFKVAAANAAGTGTPSGASAAVTPRTVPGAPTGVSATPGNAKATVSWTAPASDGGSALTGYVVTPYIGATAQTPQLFDASTTTRTVTGLTNGTAYTFKVAAGNAAGTGAASTASSAVTPSGTRALADFDGDGKTDVAVFRPSNGGWYVSGSPVTYLGLNGDVPVPADYLNAGSSQRAVWRPSTGAWFVDGGGGAVYHGLNGDVAVPGDYDGDGDTDRAVFRPSNGGWYIQGQGVSYLGLGTDIPVPADYDGDGDTDLAVFRPSTGAWYVAGSGAQYFGANGDVPLPADYDGDGNADFGVFRASTGAWFIDGVGSEYFGLSSDTPVPGNYDSDPQVDLAVFRPSNGGWYISGSSAQFFGLNGDIPASRNPALFTS